MALEGFSTSCCVGWNIQRRRNQLIDRINSLVLLMTSRITFARVFGATQVLLWQLNCESTCRWLACPGRNIQSVGLGARAAAGFRPGSHAGPSGPLPVWAGHMREETNEETEASHVDRSPSIWSARLSMWWLFLLFSDRPLVFRCEAAHGRRYYCNTILIGWSVGWLGSGKASLLLTFLSCCHLIPRSGSRLISLWNVAGRPHIYQSSL